MTTRQITAQIPAAYYDTIVTMFKGLGIDYKENLPWNAGSAYVGSRKDETQTGGGFAE